MDFKEFSVLIDARVKTLSQTGIMLRAAVSKDEVVKEYLLAFPEGTDPIYIENTTHDCNCCKGFLRQMGNVVVVKEGKILTLWDDWESYGTPYKEVAKHLQYLVMIAGVADVFKPTEVKYGADITYTSVDSPEKPRTFNHFFCDVPERYFPEHHSQITMMSNNYIPAYKSLTGIPLSAVDAVIDLIEDDNLARGPEFIDNLRYFKKALEESSASGDVDLYVWEHADDFRLSIRNTVIGSLLSDLAEGLDLTMAVKRFEDKVAPENFKRSKAIATKGMIEGAKVKIAELGLESALGRRHARPSDMRVSDILFVDRSIEKSMVSKSVLDDLVPKPKKVSDKSSTETTVSIEAFITDVLPDTRSLKVKFENKHEKNLVNMLTTKEASPQLFKWSNPFSWSYNGSLADSSLKKAVSKAGGNIIGDVRFTLGWEDGDDLDIAAILPIGGVISYERPMVGNGRLDVDMNAGTVRNVIDPVENIFWENLNDLDIGKYVIRVHNFKQRTNSGKGFTIEVDILGSVDTFTYATQLMNKQAIMVAEYEYDGKEMKLLKTNPNVTLGAVSKAVWGIQSNEYHDVTMMNLSPNHWDTKEGNKHYMFMLDKCLNPNRVRGIYNEFLRNDIYEYRKVFEMVGNATMTDYSDDQLAGLGFSETRREELSVLVDGRPYKINF